MALLQEFYKVNGKLVLSGGNALYHWIIDPYIRFLTADARHSMGLDKNGRVWSWGYNNQGQLGINSTTDRRTPISILGANKTFCSITGGIYHSLGLDKNGRVWSWGYNTYGQLGDNSVTNRCTPVSILGANKTFCSITGGSYHSLGLDKNGRVWGWGYNNKGQLGDNSVTNRRTPVSILGANKTFCSITGGDQHSLGLDKNGLIWGWGDNLYGQLGDNTQTSRCTPVSILGTNKTFCSVAAGQSHSMGLDKNGRVWSWGYNNQGQLGINSTTDRRTPISILGENKTFCSITGGSYFSLGLDKNGRVWGWGYNGKGQLGDNSVTNRCTPVSMLGVNKTFCKIVSGSSHSLGLDKYGRVWGWGYNLYGQLGDNSVISRRTPVSILGANKTFCSIHAARGPHSLAIDKNGRLWSWGYNNQGQLGDNSITNRKTPVSILGENKTFCSITGGSYFSLGLDKNGRVWGWGENTKGQLGDNSVTNRRTPVSILGANKTFCSIDVGGSYSLGLDKNGLVWGWGYNNKGQLGDNSVTSRRTPVSILGTNKTFCKISAGGSNHSLGLDKSGLIWGWGYNNLGQLGDNTQTSRRTPVSILGANKTFCSIHAARGPHSLAIDKNGRLWSWGYNTYGQLGDNSITFQCTPISILGENKTFCSITGGIYHSLGLDVNGRVWGWGYNGKGQLGDNSITIRRTPVSILGANKTFCSITCGEMFSFGLDKNGKLWGWGYNYFGQLGNNEPPNWKTPVIITTI